MITPSTGCGAAQFGVEAMILTEHFERNGGDEQLLIAGRDHRQVGAEVGEALALDVDRRRTSLPARRRGTAAARRGRRRHGRAPRAPRRRPFASTATRCRARAPDRRSPRGGSSWWSAAARPRPRPTATTRPTRAPGPTTSRPAAPGARRATPRRRRGRLSTVTGPHRGPSWSGPAADGYVASTSTSWSHSGRYSL